MGGVPLLTASADLGARVHRLARYYDLDLRDDPGDLDLYLALAARAEGPILELACGSGRVCVPLAVAGHDVVGVDIDPAMLSRARVALDAEQRPGDAGLGTLRLIEADLLEADLGARFDLVILALNSLLLLGDLERQGRAVQALARHLAPSGVAVIDVWLPTPDDLALYDGRVLEEWCRDDPETGDRVSKLSSARYDAATAAVELHTVFDAWPAAGGPTHRVDRLDRLRLVSADELLRLARDAGLRVQEFGSDHDLTPFGPGAPRAVLVATAVDEDRLV